MKKIMQAVNRAFGDKIAKNVEETTKDLHLKILQAENNVYRGVLKEAAKETVGKVKGTIVDAVNSVRNTVEQAVSKASATVSNEPKGFKEEEIPGHLAKEVDGEVQFPDSDWPGFDTPKDAVILGAEPSVVDSIKVLSQTGKSSIKKLIEDRSSGGQEIYEEAIVKYCEAQLGNDVDVDKTYFMLSSKIGVQDARQVRDIVNESIKGWSDGDFS